MISTQKFSLATVASVLLSAACMQASAEVTSEKSGFAIGLHTGTAGTGGQLTYAFNDTFSVSLNAQQLTYDIDEDYEGIDYTGELNLKSTMLLGHYHPFHGGFRFSAGIVSNGNNINANGNPRSGAFNINNVYYSAAEVGDLTFGLEFDDYASYFGIGFGAPANSDNSLTLTLDIGAIMQGDGDLTLTSKNGSLSNDPAFNADLNAELAAAEDDISDYTMHPVLQLGLHYQF